MKPFNLEQALSGKPVVTRDGRKVLEIYHFKTAAQPFTVRAVIDDPEKPQIQQYTEDGITSAVFVSSSLDLFMAPEKREWWVGLSRVGSTTYSYLATSEKAVIDDANASKAQLLAIHKLYEEEL